MFTILKTLSVQEFAIKVTGSYRTRAAQRVPPHGSQAPEWTPKTNRPEIHYLWRSDDACPADQLTLESRCATSMPQPRQHRDPLYSIGHEHADAMVRRVMITAPFGYDVQLEHLANQLDGVQLEVEDGSVGPILDGSRVDEATRVYLQPSISWASVSPVILPGHDDHKPEKTRRLIRRALHQSGIENTCEFTWSALPNFANCLSAYNYGQDGGSSGHVRPKYLEGLAAVHVWLQFQSTVSGPLSIGAGRHCGLGILANIRV